MGTWGKGILENDRALDAMKYLTKSDNSGFEAIMYFMSHSHYEEEQVLGAAIADTILNGRNDKVFPDGTYHDEWIGSLHDRFTEDEKDILAHFGWEYANCIFRILLNETDSDKKKLWTEIKERLNAVPDRGFRKFVTAVKGAEQ